MTTALIIIGIVFFFSLRNLGMHLAKLESKLDDLQLSVDTVENEISNMEFPWDTEYDPNDFEPDNFPKEGNLNDELENKDEPAEGETDLEQEKRLAKKIKKMGPVDTLLDGRDYGEVFVEALNRHTKNLK
jgi:hypothetical protein